MLLSSVVLLLSVSPVATWFEPVPTPSPSPLRDRSFLPAISVVSVPDSEVLLLPSVVLLLSELLLEFSADATWLSPLKFRIPDNKLSLLRCAQAGFSTDLCSFSGL